MDNMVDVKEKIDQWISQFKYFDRITAENMLSDLLLVRYSDFKTRILEIIDSIACNHNKIALFSVKEMCRENYHTRTTGNGGSKKIVRRRLAGSSCQMDYLLKTFAEQKSNMIARPTYQSMIAERIGGIVYVDDFIGSGKRITDFWKYGIERKIKSWLSYNKVKIYFVSYGAMKYGIKNIIESTRHIKSEEFFSVFENPTFNEANRIRELCAHYAPWGSNIYGYGNVLTNIIFEWKCPNNVPPLLWSQSDNWKPLFNNRTIDPKIFNYLFGNRTTRLTEALWTSGQYNLALGLVDRIEDLLPNDINFICYLSFVSVGLKLTNIKQKLDVSQDEIERLKHQAQKIGAVIDDKISIYGKELLEYYRNFFLKSKISLHEIHGDVIYIPTQYGGYPRI